MSAAGALLLLAAAGTFLAVSWDTMGLTARVAVVGAGTAAAILGGHRLRRRLPAVGAVVYHLGALLIPVDALGLALQLDVSPAARWLAVGVTAVVVLPVLAVVGRSVVLGWGAVAGSLALATGLGLVEVAPAPLVAAVGALGVAAGIVTAALPGRARALATPAGVALAATAVFGPIVVAAFGVLPLDGAGLQQLREAGWDPVSWIVVAGTVAVAVAAMTIATTRTRSHRLAIITLTTAVVGALSALLPAATADEVLIVLPAVVVLLVEVAAVVGRGHELWERPTAQFAGAVEALASIALFPAFTAALGIIHLGVDGDGAAPWALAVSVLAVAWAVAAARRRLAAGTRRPLFVTLATVAVLHAAFAAVLAGLPAAVAIALLLAAACASVIWWPSGRVPEPGAQSDVAAWTTAALLSVVLSVTALLFALDGHALVAVVLVAAAVTAAHVRAASRVRHDSSAIATLWLVVPAGIGVVVVGSISLAVTTLATAGLAAPLAVVALLGLASASDPEPSAANGARVVAALIGLLATSPLLRDVLGGDSWRLAEVLVVGPSALLPAGIAAVWLLIDSGRLRDPLVASLAAPVLVRTAASLAATMGIGATGTGLALVGLAVVAALGVAVGLGRWAWPVGTLALSAAAVGVPLAGLTPELRAVLLIALGLVGAAAGARRQQPVVAHLGGAVAIVGTWRLFGLREVTALDVWVLPLAAHLWVVGVASRRKHGTSSWVADVPPLLLVAIPAMVERAAGGSGWHAVLAGGVAVLAIAGGGAARLGGPLVIGTGVLIAVVGVEVFAAVVAVPTWIWLALGGATLLGAGAAMELAAGSPVSAAKRFVRLLRERFD